MGRLTAIAETLGAPQVRHRRRGGIGGGADRRNRAPLVAYVLRADLLTIVTAPVIYSLIVPFVMIDVWVSIYQAICFRAWGAVRVRRSAFFAIDRHRLPYLNALEKAHCVYCSYVNGVIAYAREVAARTEQDLVSNPRCRERPRTPRSLRRICPLRRRCRLPRGAAVTAREAQAVDWSGEPISGVSRRRLFAHRRRAMARDYRRSR